MVVFGKVSSGASVITCRKGLSLTNIRRPGNALPTIVLFVFLVGIYLDVGAAITEEIRIPSVIALVVLPFLALLARFRARDFWLLLTILCLVAIAIPFAPGEAVIGRRVLAIAQLTVAILAGISAARLMARLHESTLDRLFLCLWLMVVCLAILEALGIGSALSDQFRQAAFGDLARIDESYSRDMELVGRNRPAVFTAEPSYAYLGFIVFSTAWLLVRFSWPKAFIILAANVVMVVLMGSPLFLLAVLAIALISIASVKRKVIGYGVVSLLVVATFGAAYLVGGGILDLLVERLDVSDIEAYSSTHLRIVYPVLALIDVTSVSPIVGLGLGGEVNLEQYSRFALSYLEAAGTNAFVILLIVMGPVGGLLFMCVLVSYWRQEWTARVLMALFLFLFVAAQMGGSVTLRFWGYVFVLIGALAVADRVQARRNRAIRKVSADRAGKAVT